eukprot:311517-Amorphochlora_amoeboformis.AAC.1
MVKTTGLLSKIVKKTHVAKAMGKVDTSHASEICRWKKVDTSEICRFYGLDGRPLSNRAIKL